MKTLRNRVIAWFLLACTILCVLCFATYRSILTLNEQSNWVTHTYEVLMQLDNVIISTKDVQTAARGYILIGDERYHNTALSSGMQLSAVLDQLALTTKDNPVQSVRITPLRAASEDVIEFYQKAMKEYDLHGLEAGASVIKTQIGQQRVDTMRDLVGTFRDTELKLLTERREQVDHALMVTVALCTLGVLACMGILAFVFAIVDRETRRRSESERVLQQTLHDLEIVNGDRLHIAQMGDFLQSCRTPEEVHDLVRQNMPRMFEGSHGLVGLTSNSRNMIDSVASWGEITSSLEQFMPSDCWAMRRGKIHCVHAGAQEPDCVHLIARMPAYACVPLLAHGETMGVLYIAHTENDYFDERRLLMLRTIAEQISLAIANMKLQDALRMQTLRDPLTQLYNRRYMESSLERELLRARRSGQPLSVMMLDIDHFKRFNDTFGHDSGDALLKEFGKLLQRNVRGEDIACRYGGEEFILILPTCPEDIAIKRAHKIIQETRQLAIHHNHQDLGKITVSIGIALFPAHAEEVEPLVKAADRALYRAKQDGRDRFTIAQ